jgi:hypothetical protein
MSSSSPSSYSHYLPRTSGGESVMSSAYDAYRNRTLDEANNYLSIDISTDTRPGNHQHHHHRALEKTTLPSSSVSWYDRSKYSQNNRYAYDIHDNDNFYIRKFGDFYMTSGGGCGSESKNQTQTAAVSCEQKPSSSLVAQQQQQQELNASYENNKVGLILLFYFFFFHFLSLYVSY